jgi:predicted nuclease of predicted toxin-antitoxin system
VALRILVNEKVRGDAAETLRRRGDGVVRIRSTAPGSSDLGVLRRAEDERRILMTLDKDVGELAFRRQAEASAGIILVRVPVSGAGRVAAVVVAALESRDDWAGHVSVIQADRIRMLPLPDRGEES